MAFSNTVRRVWRSAQRRLGKRTHRTMQEKIDACPLPSGYLIWLEAEGDVEPHFCEPLDDPDWVPVSEATSHLETDAIVGVVNEGGAWGFPWWVMKNHHVANVDLGGHPYVLSFCEVCATAGLYDPVIEGERFRWRVVGAHNGTTLHRDDRTGSLWSGMMMRPLHGPATELPRPDRLPVIQCSWPEWREMHPEGWVVSGIGEDREGHGAGRLRPDHQLRAFQSYKIAPDDPRLDQHELVCGIEHAGDALAVPLTALHAAGGVLTAEVGGTELIVVSRPGTWIANAFERYVDGRPVELVWTDQTTLRDQASGAEWDPFGTPVDGDGPRLAFVRSGIEKWYAWSGIFPETRIVTSA